jgi:hypothetical protein
MEQTELYGPLLNGQNADYLRMQDLLPDAGKKKNPIEQFLEDAITSLINVGRYEMALTMLDDVKHTYSNYEHYKNVVESKYGVR